MSSGPMAQAAYSAENMTGITGSMLQLPQVAKHERDRNDRGGLRSQDP